MKEDDFNPVVETQSEQPPSAVIVSGHRGLAYFLATELEQHGLSVSVVLVKQQLLPSAGDFYQQDWDSLTNLESLKSDYLYCLVPSVKPYASLLLPVVQHCQETQTKLLVVEYISDKTDKAKEISSFLSANAKGLDYRVAYLAQTYGEWAGEDASDQISDQLIAALSLGQITLPQDVETPLFLTHFGDIARGLVLAMFKDSTIGQQYFLSNLEKTPVAEFSQLLKPAFKEVGRKLDINFTNEAELPAEPDFKLVAFTQANLDWYPATELRKSLPAVIENLAQIFPPEEKAESFDAVDTPKVDTQVNTQSARSEIKPQLRPLNGPVQPPEVSKPKRRRLQSRGVKMILSALVLILLVTFPFAVFIFSSFRGINQLQEAVGKLSEGKIDQARTSALAAQITIERSRSVVNTIRPLVFFNPGWPEKYDRLLDAASRISQTVGLTADTLEQLQGLYGYITLGQPAIDVSSTITLASSNLTDLYNRMALISASLERVQFDSHLNYFNDLEKLKKRLVEWQKAVDVGSKTLTVVSPLLTSKTPRNILLVIQNSSELRPTGGFIDGVVLVTLRNGRLVNTQYQDVFTLDRQLQGFVEPPPAIKKYLGETNWFLRDANWSPDFAASAAQIKWFYEKETGVKLDGVVAANLFTLRYFLQNLGSLPLESWSETVSATNMFDKILQLSKATPDGKSENEPKYPSLELSRVILENLTQEPSRIVSFAPALASALDESQISFYFTDPELEQVGVEYNWDGSLRTKPCYPQFATSGCVAETFAINEANVGINKTNLFLERSISHQVEIDGKGKIKHSIEIEYHNSATSQTWPEGDYKAYVRFYAPLGTELQAINLNGVTLGLEETKSTPFGLTEFSFPIQVRIGETAKLNLSLRSPNIINTQGTRSALTINWEKQSGTDIEPLRLTVKYPAGLASEAVSLPTINGSGSTQFLVQFKHDQPLAVLFKRVP